MTKIRPLALLLITQVVMSWPVRKLLTDGVTRDLFGWGWAWDFTMDETHAEYMGYLAGTQTPDNMIHIISSGIHYRMNLKWIETPPAE